MNKLTISTFLFLLTLCLQAQYNQEEILPELSGQELYQALVDDFKPSDVLNYSQCRDTMYHLIYNQQDSIRAVYSGFTRYLDPSQDPSTELYSNGNALSINTEHTYPQSKGASAGNAKSDMHHLFPTRTLVNSARGSDVFGEIDDEETDVWFANLDDQTSIPETMIDQYSEDTNGVFEPREDHKGNVARAMMYFYTMYRSEALSADAGYFPSQQEILCQWHLQDPVDSLEWHRSAVIGDYQDGKANPFVLDCSLAQRLYCEESVSCYDDENTALENHSRELLDFDIFPNPSNGLINIKLNLERKSKVQVALFNSQGKQVYQSKDKYKSGENEIKLTAELPKGIYYCRIKIENRKQNLEQTKRLVLIAN